MATKQETWLRPPFDFSMQGYTSAHCDRVDSQGSGCVTFVKDNTAFSRLQSPTDMEFVDVNLKIINFYNLCKTLSIEIFNALENVNSREIWGGGF